MKNFKTLLKLTILTLSLAFVLSSGTDKTIEDRAVGQDVVEAVTQLIDGLNIFPNDYRFFIRTAYVGTEFGNHPNTFAQKNGADYHGGIWQVDQARFLTIKHMKNHPEMAKYFTKIQDRFNIDWKKLTWVDCRKPLVSGLAVRMSMLLLPLAIPDTIRAQGDFWFKYFDSAPPTGTAQDFVNRAKAMEKLNKCRGRMELVMVMQGSASVDESDFKLAKQFTASFFETFSPDFVNLGFIVYIHRIDLVFPLDSGLSIEEMKERILSTSHPYGAIDTDAAMIYAVNLFKNSDHSTQVGRPRIMTVLTQGWSEEGGFEGAEAALGYNITTFSIGTDRDNKDELLVIAANDSTHVLIMDNYQDLSESFEMVNAQTCKIAQTPPIGVTVADSLEQGEKRYYCYEMTLKGITVVIEIQIGSVTSNYSYIVESPSSALNDGIISGTKYIPAHNARNAHGRVSSKVCITIKGDSTINNITVVADVGNTATFTCPVRDIIRNKCVGPKDCLYPNPGNCNTYIKCTLDLGAKSGTPVVMPFPAGLEWNNRGKICDWPANSTCRR